MPSRWGGLRAYFFMVLLDLLSLAFVAGCMYGLTQTDVQRESYRVVPMWTTSTGAHMSDIFPTGGKDDNADYSPDAWETLNAYLVGPLEYSYPRVEEIITPEICMMVVLIVPMVIVSLFQLKLKSLWDLHAGISGVLKALVLVTFFQVVLKQAIGGFRPHYLDVCRPVLTAAAKYYKIVNNIIWVPTTACTGRNQGHISYALTSFPSGHCATSFAVGSFLVLYINAKLKTFADFRSDFWAVFATIAPLIGASVIAGQLLVDHHHHPRDVIFGILIGIIAGVVSYRTSYASLIDFRYNHIPLPPLFARIRFSYNLFHGPGVPDHILGTNAELADRLVVMNWWGKAGPEIGFTEGRWLRSLKSLRRTDMEMGKRKDSVLPPYPASIIAQSPLGDRRGSLLFHTEPANHTSSHERRMSGALATEQSPATQSLVTQSLPTGGTEVSSEIMPNGQESAA